jgi:ParB-like chromosome segregation protein Spo0J
MTNAVELPDIPPFLDRRKGRQGREFHALANIFPPLEGEDFDALVADIKAHGLHEPVVLFEDKILDGRNRYRKSSNETSLSRFC